jgi:hypothetical protein
MIRPIPRVPIYLLTRGFCDEGRLGDNICKTWEQIPGEHRRAMIKFLTARSTKRRS